MAEITQYDKNAAVSTAEATSPESSINEKMRQKLEPLAEQLIATFGAEAAKGMIQSLQNAEQRQRAIGLLRSVAQIAEQASAAPVEFSMKVDDEDRKKACGEVLTTIGTNIDLLVTGLASRNRIPAEARAQLKNKDLGLASVSAALQGLLGGGQAVGDDEIPKTLRLVFSNPEQYPQFISRLPEKK